MAGFAASSEAGIAPDRPLHGLKVVEVAGRLSSRVAAAILQDMGASVVRIGGEAPTLAELDAPVGNMEAVTIALDRGKVRLDCTPTDLPAEWRDADILLTSGDGPADRDVWLQAAGPDVSVHLSPYGLSGPYAGRPATEMNLVSYGATAAYVGDRERAPIAPPIMLASVQAGVFAALSAVAALRREGKTRIDLAEADVLATNHVAGLYSLSALVGDIPLRAGQRKPNPYPFTILPCKDGHVSIVFLSGRQWAKLLKVMGDPEWGRDPRFADRRVNGVKHVAELDQRMTEWLSQYSKAELRDIAVRNGLPIAPLQTVDELLTDRQLAARDFLLPADGPKGPVKAPRIPFLLRNLSDAPAGKAHHSPARLPAESLPLAGVKVVDLGWVLSGPMVGQVLADLGADVVKVESRTRLDSSRLGLPLMDVDPKTDSEGVLANVMPHFNNVNRGKRSIVVDVGNDAGKEVLARLVAEADMVIENFGAGSLERLGLSPAWFAAIRPDLVLARISIGGQQGPDASMRGYAAQSTALGGLDALCAYRGEGPVGLITLNLGDVSGALFAAAGAIAALHRRDRTGEGSVVDTSMMESAAFHLGPQMIARQLDAADAAPLANSHLRFAPHGIFPTLEDGAWISIAVRSDAEWRELCAILDLPEAMAGLSQDARHAQREEIGKLIATRSAERLLEELHPTLADTGMAVAPVHAIEGLRGDPSALGRQSIVSVDHHLLGPLPIYGTPLRSEPPIAAIHGRAPDLAEHNVEILGELGIADAELDRLAEAGAFEGTHVRRTTETA